MIRGLALASLLAAGLVLGACASETARGIPPSYSSYSRCTDSPRRNPYAGSDARPESQPLFFIFCTQGP